MWDSSYTHTHHIINQIRASQSPPLKSLTSSLGPTLQGSVSELTWGYRTGSDTICNNPRKSANHICAIPQKDQSQLKLFVVVNKAQIYLVNIRRGTHHTLTHITQSIKLGHHIYRRQKKTKVKSLDHYHMRQAAKSSRKKQKIKYQKIQILWSNFQFGHSVIHQHHPQAHFFFTNESQVRKQLVQF